MTALRSKLIRGAYLAFSFLLAGATLWAQGCSGSVQYTIGSSQLPVLACSITPTGGAFVYTSSVAYTSPANPPHAWLSVNPASGSIAVGVQGEIDYDIDPTGLPVGEYYATVTLHASGFADSVDQIHLSVLAGSATTSVSIALPSISGVNVTVIIDGTTYTSNETFSWVIGSVHTISVPPVVGPDGTEITFIITSSDGTVSGNPIQFTVNSTTVSFTITQVTTVAVPSISAVTNGASNQAGSIAPGEIVALYGSGLGPAQLTQYHLTSAGLLDTQVAGTQVRFNGILAPIIYASASQVAAIVPYEVSGSSVLVSLTYQGESSAAVSVPLALSAPALFTLNSSGQGPAAALNQDYSLNSANNPAKVGDIISLYATGEGQTTPTGVDGKVAVDPLPHPVLPVSVTIGGQPAQVQYAGGAPGEVAGVLQVNAYIPSGIQTGNAVSVVVQVGNAVSPPGVTLAVR
jgi:trimeric autotransporter adhesin